MIPQDHVWRWAEGAPRVAPHGYQFPRAEDGARGARLLPQDDTPADPSRGSRHPLALDRQQVTLARARAPLSPALLRVISSQLGECEGPYAATQNVARGRED